MYSNNIVFNTGETQEVLRAKYNPDGSLLRKVQLRALDMLKYIDKVCREQDISYRIDAGQILGAVRHGGFIPWDDDIDIVLPRKDYKRLCKYLEEHPHKQYVLQSFNTERHFVGAWVVFRDTKSEYIQNRKVHNVRKYRGVQVDIFPYENRIIRPFHKFAALLVRKNQDWFIEKHVTIARIIYKILFNILFPVFRFLGKIFGDNNIYMTSYGVGFFRRHPKSSLVPYKPIMFEGMEFPGPANVDSYLREQYDGDYMNLPPVEKRNHHHVEYKIWD